VSLSKYAYYTTASKRLVNRTITNAVYKSRAQTLTQKCF